VKNRVFLTGASGNVGHAVLAELARREFDIVALVRKEVPDVKGYRPLFGDLECVREFAHEIASVDAVIHCASPRTTRRAAALRTDIEATGQMLEAWGSGPFVYTSSQTVYGIPTGPLVEDAILRPSNWYDIAKICNEYQVALAADGRDIRTGVSLRLPLVFASGPRRRDRQFLPMLFDSLRAGRPFLFGSEEAVETCGSVWIGEEDLGRAVVASLRIGRSGAYNLAGGFCTWRELLECIGRHARLQPTFVVRAGALPNQNEHRLPQSRSDFVCELFQSATRFAASQTLDEVVGKFVGAEMRT